MCQKPFCTDFLQEATLPDPNLLSLMEVAATQKDHSQDASVPTQSKAPMDLLKQALESLAATVSLPQGSDPMAILTQIANQVVTPTISTASSSQSTKNKVGEQANGCTHKPEDPNKASAASGSDSISVPSDDKSQLENPELIWIHMSTQEAELETQVIEEQIQTLEAA